MSVLLCRSAFKRRVFLPLGKAASCLPLCLVGLVSSPVTAQNATIENRHGTLIIVAAPNSVSKVALAAGKAHSARANMTAKSRGLLPSRKNAVRTAPPNSLLSARATAVKAPPLKRAAVPGATFGNGVNTDAWQAAAVEIVAAGRGRINYAAGVIKAIGLGAIAPPTLRKSRSQDLLDARDAAFNDAIRSLSLAVSQVRVTADTRVSNYVLRSDEVRTRVEGLLRNATIVEEKILPKSGVYRVVVQAQMSGPNSLMEAIEPGTSHPTPSPTPKPLATPRPPVEKTESYAPGAPAPEGAEYTSLIVDCRGLRVSACMSPRIYDGEHREVYGTMKISADYVIETGIAAFPRSVGEARRCQRAGNNPLVVRAVGVADANRFYPVIRNRDAERARAANETSHFFERTAVILLLDPDS